MITITRWISVLTTVLVLTGPTVVQAYVGPGAGLGLLAAFWALLVAMGAVLFFVLAWPIRRLMRRSRTTPAPVNTAESDRVESDSEPGRR